MRIDGASYSPVFHPTPAGDRYHQLYRSSLDRDGRVVLRPGDRIDIQASIESYRSMTDMSYITQCLASGIPVNVTTREPFYGDFTEVPSTLAEILQLSIDARAQFDSLSPDVRRQFGDDFNRWFVSAGSPDWAKRMGFSAAADPVQDPKQDPGTTDKTEVSD